MFDSFGCYIRGEIDLQTLQTVWVAKASLKKYSMYQAQSPWNSRSCCALSIFRSNVFVAPSETVSLMNEANIVNEDSSVLSDFTFIQYAITLHVVQSDMCQNANHHLL